MELYLVAILLQPTEKQKFDDGAVPTLIVQPTAILASSEAQAVAKAFKFIPEEHQGKEDRLLARVLPFRAAAR
jgi:hypothetical protein